MLSSQHTHHTKRPNAICERFLLSVRRECPDHAPILSEKQLHRVLRAYIKYFNQARPHQGIHQQVPQGEVTYVPSAQPDERIISVPVLGGLHPEYRRVPERFHSEAEIPEQIAYRVPSWSSWSA